MTWDVDKWMDEVLRPGRRRSPTGAAARAGPVGPDRSHDGVPRHPRARVDGCGGRGPPAPGVRRAAAGAARAGAAQARARAHDARASATTSAASWCGGSTSGCRSRSPARSSGRSARSSSDLAGPHPMHRLLQGDVGAGKTIVAVSALLVAVQGGHQGALMAPTEVLAEQHFLGVRDLLDGLHRPRHRPRQPVRRGRHGAPAAGRAADQPHHGGRAAAHPGRRWRRARSTWPSAPTR